MKTKSSLISLVIILMFCMMSCSKDAGEGGNSSIYGKVYTRDYNSNFTVLVDEYFAPEEDVYIIYGNDITYSDRVKTNYDGTYEFKYLRPGKYRIYAYSADSTMQTTAKIAKVVDVEISDKKQEVEAPLINITE